MIFDVYRKFKFFLELELNQKKTFNETNLTMKKITKSFFGTLLLLLMITSCETEDTIITGDMSFSCYINGELFTPKASTSISVFPAGEKLTFNRDSYFSVKATDHQDFRIFFNIENFDIGTFNLGVSDGNTYEYEINHAVIFAYANGDQKYVSKGNSGTITFTDVSDTNVEGTFEFTLYNENDENDVIIITDGRFND